MEKNNSNSKAKLPEEFSQNKDVVSSKDQGFSNVKLQGHKQITEQNKQLNPDLNEQEARRIQSKLGNMRDQTAKFYVDKEKEFKNLDEQEGISKQSTVFFGRDKGCIYTLKSTCTKVLIEYCNDCTFIFASRIMTATVEMYNCHNCRVEVRADVHTLQADVCDNLVVNFEKKSQFYQVVHAALNNFTLSIGETKDEIKSDFALLKKEHDIAADREKITQFLTRYVNEKLVTEKAVRLPNGQLTTQREKDEFDERARKNEQIYLEKAEQMLKKVPTKKMELYNQNHKKQGRNDKCQCGSGKKYKSCCMNAKPTIHGNNNNNNNTSKEEK